MPQILNSRSKLGTHAQSGLALAVVLIVSVSAHYR
jgi:hypothetical protein